MKTIKVEDVQLRQAEKKVKAEKVKAERIAEMKRTCVPCWKGGEV